MAHKYSQSVQPRFMVISVHYDDHWKHTNTYGQNTVPYGKQLCLGIPSWTQLYCQIYKNTSTTCFGPYGHLQVGHEIRRKTICNMVHDIHKCGVRGDEISFTKIWRACGITQIYDLSGVYMYGVLAGGVLGVGLLVCGVVSAVSMGGGVGVVHRSAWASVWTS